jgi:hypothetical protein
LLHCWLQSSDPVAVWWRQQFFDRFWPTALRNRRWRNVPATEKNELLRRLWEEFVPRWNQQCWETFAVSIEWSPKPMKYKK